LETKFVFYKAMFQRRVLQFKFHCREMWCNWKRFQFREHLSWRVSPWTSSLR